MDAKQKLTHLDESGKARMVNVGEKAVTARRAMAEGGVPKGEVLGGARVAGIMAAKRTGELIPLCHPLPVESVEVDFDLPAFDPEDGEERVRLRVKGVATISAKTGVELEALTAVSVAAPGETGGKRAG